MFAIGFFDVALTVVILGGGLVLVMWLFNRRAARHAFQAGGAQVGKFGNWLWQQDPRANYQKVIDDAADEIGHATEAIEENKALVNSLTRQVDDSRQEVARLQARLDNSLADDPDDKGGKAAEYMAQLELAKSNLAKNEDQLKRVTILYQLNLKKVQMARQKIKEAQDRGRQIGVELEMAKTNARISKLATTVNVNAVNMEGLGEVEDEMRRQIDKYNAVSEVQSDLGTDGMKEMDEEERLRKADAKRKLEEYKKSKGIGQAAKPAV